VKNVSVCKERDVRERLREKCEVERVIRNEKKSCRMRKRVAGHMMGNCCRLLEKMESEW
jgi:hypothetical protein